MSRMPFYVRISLGSYLLLVVCACPSARETPSAAETSAPAQNATHGRASEQATPGRVTSTSSKATIEPPATKTVAVSHWTDDDRTHAITKGRALLLAQQCNRCHLIDDLPRAGRALDCSGCHSFLDGLKPSDRLFKKIAAKTGEALLLRYQENIQHLKRERVPDLTAIAGRVRPAFIDRFLSAPWDLRPTLSESMIRTNLTDPERQTLVRYFAAKVGLDEPYAYPLQDDDSSLPDKASIARGRQLFSAKACQVCHTFGNVSFDDATPEAARQKLEQTHAMTALAPNLRFVRERTRSDVLVDWILDPQRLKPGTTMPPMGLTRAQAQDVANFLRGADPELLDVRPVSINAPRVLGRQVGYQEMKERTLGKVCVHCHMNDYEKDPGPGNLGGLGYAGIGLSLRTYETLVQGAMDANQKRYSVLEPTEPGHLPPLVEVLLIRKNEHTRDQVRAFSDRVRPPFPEARRGMPLGLPSLSNDEIDILFTWIAQGCIGPTSITGQPGVGDGFLVPDGPIVQNRGCGQRDPSPQRPRWAVDAKVVGQLPAPP